MSLPAAGRHEIPRLLEGATAKLQAQSTPSTSSQQVSRSRSRSRSGGLRPSGLGRVLGQLHFPVLQFLHLKHGKLLRAERDSDRTVLVFRLQLLHTGTHPANAAALAGQGDGALHRWEHRPAMVGTQVEASLRAAIQDALDPGCLSLEQTDSKFLRSVRAAAMPATPAADKCMLVGHLGKPPGQGATSASTEGHAQPCTVLRVSRDGAVYCHGGCPCAPSVTGIYRSLDPGQSCMYKYKTHIPHGRFSGLQRAGIFIWFTSGLQQPLVLKKEERKVRCTKRCNIPLKSNPQSPPEPPSSPLSPNPP